MKGNICGLHYENEIERGQLLRRLRRASREGRLHPAIAAELHLPTGEHRCMVCGMLHFEKRDADDCCLPGVIAYEKMIKRVATAADKYGIDEGSFVLPEDPKLFKETLARLVKEAGGQRPFARKLSLHDDWPHSFLGRGRKSVYAPVAAVLVDTFGELPGLGEFPPPPERLSSGNTPLHFGGYTVTNPKLLAQAINNRTRGRRNRLARERGIPRGLLDQLVAMRRSWLTERNIRHLRLLFPDGDIPGVVKRGSGD